MPASQLTQLKAALSTAGLHRKNASKKDRKAFKKGGAREVDKQKTLAKLEEIRKGLNKFDERETRLKHDVGGRNLKGVTGRPSASKQAGLEQRRKSLLPEHQLRDHTGSFRDRRFGESDPSLSVEDRMLERYTRERQRGQGKRGLFNLDDDDDLLGEDDGNALGGLTHGGRSVADLPGDDFEMQGLGEDDEELDTGWVEGREGRRKFLPEDRDEDGEPRKKSKQEVMSEVIAKSKEHKYERQQQREMDAEMREELDENVDDLRALLQETAPRALRVDRVRPNDGPADADYDQFVRTLAFEARAKPKDRTKTEEELALEEKARLEAAEASRLRRMRGDMSDDEGQDQQEAYRKKRRLADGDDLEDDFVEEEDEMFGQGLTREAIEDMALPLASESESGDDAASDTSSADESEYDSAMDDLDEEDGSDDSASEIGAVAAQSNVKHRGVKPHVKEIPFTFPCPTSIDELEDIMDGLDDDALPTVVHRIRALHHPSLAQGNKEKLQDFMGVLVDYALLLSSRAPPASRTISALVPHITSLVLLNPLVAASYFTAKLSLVHKNLSKGLARGPSRLESRTFFLAPELTLLRLVGAIWSTSDFSHPVVAPSVLLMTQCLAQARVRHLSDVGSGVFLCTLLAQYERQSKRILPEATTFLALAVAWLVPRKAAARLPPTFPELRASGVEFALSSTATPRCPVRLWEVLDSGLASDDDLEQCKADLLSAALTSIQTFASLYADSPAFSELFSPICGILEGSRTSKIAPALAHLHDSTLGALRKRLDFFLQARQPLALQRHKPVPIPSFAPRFESDYAPGRHYDPDVERNAASKLKTLYKKERKGAIRELRKDNRFLAGEKAKERREKDEGYDRRMRQVLGGIGAERAEEKAMEREKQREKRRAGKK